MVKSRLYFLKLNVLSGLFLTLCTAFTVLFPFTGLFEDSTFAAITFFWILIGVFFILLIAGCFRAFFLYIAYFLLLFAMTVSLQICVVRAIMLSPSAPPEFAFLIGFHFPFNYIGLSLYCFTSTFILYKASQRLFFLKQSTGSVLADRDLDFQNHLIFYDYKPTEIKLDPRKQRASVWLTVVTQVFLLKMSWPSPTGSILTLLSFSFISFLTLVVTVTIIFRCLDILDIERRNHVKLKPALRKPFKLWKTMMVSQNNSY